MFPSPSCTRCSGSRASSRPRPRHPSNRRAALGALIAAPRAPYHAREHNIEGLRLGSLRRIAGSIACRGRRRPRRARLALDRGAAGVRDGRRRRGDAAHRIGPVDHRVAAAARRHSAAERGRLASGVREVQGDPRVQHRQRGHVARRLQVHLLVGVDAPAARAPHRRGLRHPVPRILGYGPAAAGAAAEALRRAGAGRPAGLHRLVHGEIRARRPHRREPVPPRAAPADRVRRSCRCSSGSRSMPDPRLSACACRR